MKLTSISLMLKIHTVILVALLFFACGSKRYAPNINSAKTGKYIRLKYLEGDTVRYVARNFVDGKNKYIGKKLKELLKDVELPIMYYNFESSSRGSKKIPSLSLFFFPKAEVWRKMDEHLSPSNLIIVWSNGGLPYDKVVALGRKNKGKWDSDAMDYYGEQIIGDIQTSNWVK